MWWTVDPSSGLPPRELQISTSIDSGARCCSWAELVFIKWAVSQPLLTWEFEDWWKLETAAAPRSEILLWWEIETFWWEQWARKPSCKIQLAKSTRVLLSVRNHLPSAWADEITWGVSMHIRAASSHHKTEQETNYPKDSPTSRCPVTQRPHSWTFPTIFKARKYLGDLSWAPEGQFWYLRVNAAGAEFAHWIAW